MSTKPFSRRRFLGHLSALFSSFYLTQSIANAGQGEQTTQNIAEQHIGRKPRVGIALGAGGANGLAHILMLETLDKRGIKPHAIAGSSIGAVIGALYASGKSGRQIRELVERFIISPQEHVVEELLSKDALRWVEFLDIEFGEGGLLSSEGFMSFMYDTIGQITFEDLRCPLKVTAGDLWTREQVVLESGDLLSAIKASMALPGIFQPVIHRNRVLVDGGTVNPVPYDLLVDDCDIVIGIDVIGQRSGTMTEIPGYLGTILNAAEIMQHAIMSERLRHMKPAIYISPDIVNVRALEFFRARQVYEQAEPARLKLEQQLAEVLNAW